LFSHIVDLVFEFDMTDLTPDLLNYLYFFFFAEVVVGLPNDTCVNGNYLFKRHTCASNTYLIIYLLNEWNLPYE